MTTSVIELSHTRRLTLRLLASEHESEYIALYRDPRVMRKIGEPLSEATAREHFTWALRANQYPPRIRSSLRKFSDPFESLPWDRRQLPFQSLRVAAEVRESGRLAAIYSADRWDPDGSQWEMGVIAPSQAQGHGLAVEGMRALADQLQRLGVSRLLLRCKADNLAACRVARLMGFTGKTAETELGAVMLWSRLAVAADRWTLGVRKSTSGGSR